MNCASCASPLTGPFCAACGERVVEPQAERLGHFVREQFQEVTSADGKLWRTFRALFSPGKLTTEYFAGRRSLYVRPVRVFLVANVVLFFAIAGNTGTVLNGPLRSHEGAFLYGNAASRTSGEKAEAWGISSETFEQSFDAKAAALAPTAIMVLIPALALALAFILWPLKESVLRHVVLATHLVAAMIAVTLLLLTVLSLLLRLAASLGAPREMTASIDPILVPAFLLWFLAYATMSVRRVYGLRRPTALAAGVVLGTLGIAFAFWTFRFALFLLTIARLDPPA